MRKQTNRYAGILVILAAWNVAGILFLHHFYRNTRLADEAIFQAEHYFEGIGKIQTGLELYLQDGDIQAMNGLFELSNEFNEILANPSIFPESVAASSSFSNIDIQETLYRQKEIIRDLQNVLDANRYTSNSRERLRNIVKRLEDSLDGQKALSNVFLNHWKTFQAQQFQWINTTIILEMLGLFSLLALLAFWYTKYFLQPLSDFGSSLSALAIGNLDTTVRYTQQNEMGYLGKQLNKVISHQQKLKSFIEKTGKGELQIEVPSSGPNDTLGGTLQQLQEQLNKLDQEDKQRQWSSEGLNRFSELLRVHHDNVSQLAEEITVGLAKHMNANQAAFFLLIEEEGKEPYLEMQACYAWEHLRTVEHRVSLGEGLLGQAVREKDTLLITDVPQNFIRITSGLGKALPTCVLIVPLKINQQVSGALEIAAFHNYDPIEVNFLEKLAESIASTIGVLKSNEKTKDLLQESLEMTDQLTQQEEEMRQNLEELRSTQEAMQRKEREMSGLLKAIDQGLATVELDHEQRFITANNNFLRLIDFRSADALKGKHYQDILINQEEGFDLNEAFWRNVFEDHEVYTGTFKWRTPHGKEFWLDTTYAPVIGSDGEVYKVIQLSRDITFEKHTALEHRRLSLVADNTGNSVIITDSNGYTEYVNKSFARISGYTLEDMLGKKPGEVLQGKDTDPNTTKRIARKLNRQEAFYEEILNYHKDGTPYWISLSVNPIFSKDGKLEKFISLQTDITQTKQEALNNRYKMEAVSRANGLMELDLKGNITYVNDLILHYLSYSAGELYGKHFDLLVTEQSRETGTYKGIWKQLAKKRSDSGDFLFHSFGSNHVWLRCNFSVILGLYERPEKYIVVAQDITHQKELEIRAQKQSSELVLQKEKLQRYTKELEGFQHVLEQKLNEARNEMHGQIKEIEASKARNSAILEGCLDGVISFNHRGTVEFFNKAAEDIWGCDRSEVLGRSITLLLPLQFETESDELKVFIKASDEDLQPIEKRTKAALTSSWKEETFDVFLTITQIKIEGEYTFTLFVQNISIEPS